MSIKRKFKSTILNQQYLFKNGKSAHFVNGEFLTGNDLEIAELDSEIENGIPFLYIDENDKVVDTTLQDKIKEAQAEAALRVLKEHEKGEVVKTTSNVDTQSQLGGAAQGNQTSTAADTQSVTNVGSTPAIIRPSNATLLANLKSPDSTSPAQKSTGIAASTDQGGNEQKL